MQAPDYSGLNFILIAMLIFSVFGIWKIVDILIWIFTNVKVII